MVNSAFGDSASSSLTPEFGGQTTLQDTWVELSSVRLGLQSERKTPENTRILPATLRLTCAMSNNITQVVVYQILKRRCSITFHYRSKIVNWPWAFCLRLEQNLD